MVAQNLVSARKWMGMALGRCLSPRRVCCSHFPLVHLHQTPRRAACGSTQVYSAQAERGAALAGGSREPNRAPNGSRMRAVQQFECELHMAGSGEVTVKHPKPAKRRLQVAIGCHRGGISWRNQELFER